MAGEVAIEQIADDMYGIVAENAGMKKMKATDLTKAMIGKYGDQVSKQDCKDAIKLLIDSGRCIYGYFGGSSIELPRAEGAANQ